MKVQYTIHFKGCAPVEGALEYPPDRDYLREIDEIVIRKTIELKKLPEVLVWRFNSD